MTNITVGGKIAKVLDWGNDFVSEFAGFVFDGAEFGWRMVYACREVPTVRPANGIYTVTSVRSELVLFKDGDKDYLDEYLTCSFFTIEGWDHEYMVVDGDTHYWVPVKGEGFDFSDLSIEAIVELGRECDNDFADYAARQERIREDFERYEDEYYDFLEKSVS